MTGSGRVAEWRTASVSASGDCVEVGTWVHTVGLVNRVVAEGVLVRDSKHPDGPMLTLTRAAFGALLDAIKEDTRG